MRGRRFSIGESSTGLITSSTAELKRTLSSNGLGSRHGCAAIRRELSSHIERAAQTAFSPYRQAYYDLLSSPFEQAVGGDGSILGSWLAEPLFVSDEELSRIINIRESTVSSDTFNSAFVCYFRSWKLSVDQFRTILTDLEMAGEDIRRFKDALLYCGQDVKNLTIRYVGQTSGRQSPWTRSKRTLRHGSLLKMFLQSFDKNFPTSSMECKIFEIIDSRIDAFSILDTHSYAASQHLINQMERVLISLFRPATLFNKQSGGVLSDHGLDSSCEEVLSKCKTALLAKIGSGIHPMCTEDTERVKELFKAWWDKSQQELWKNYNPVPTESFVESTINQALPMKFSGATLAVICGMEPPHSTMKDGASFLSGKRATGLVIRNILDSIARLELGTQSSTNIFQSLIGFNQLFNLPDLRSGARELSRTLMDSWLSVIKPLLIFPLGAHVTGWMRAHKRRGNFPTMIHETGVARVVSLPLKPSLSVIVIPMLHPGYLRTQLSKDQYQVHWLSCLSAWVHLDTALGLIIDGTARITDRESFLSKVIEEARTRLHSAGFLELLTAVKKRMAAGVPELVKFIPTIDSARIPEDNPEDKLTTGTSSLHWSAEEITTLETLMKLGKSNGYIAERLGRSSMAVSTKQKRVRLSIDKEKTIGLTSSSIAIPRRLTHRKMGGDSRQLSNDNASRPKTWRWSSTEIATLRTLKEANKSNEEIATILNRTNKGVGRVWSRLKTKNTTAHHTDRGEMESARAEINLALVEAGNHTETAAPPHRKRALVELPTPQDIKRSRIGV